MSVAIPPEVEARLDQERALYDRIWREKAGEYSASSPEVELLTRRLPISLYPSGRVLVVGAGNGPGFRLLLEHGCDAHACDLSREVARFYSDMPERFKACPAHATPYRDGEFDAVVCVDVLEHLLPELVDASLDEIVRVCRSKGRLLLQARCAASVFEPNLHKSVHPWHWWMERFKDRGTAVWQYVDSLDVAELVEKS